MKYKIKCIQYLQSDGGGEKMAMETIQSVREAEQLAAQKEKDAHAEVEQIVSRAETESKELLVSIQNSIQEYTVSALNNAKVQSVELMNAAKSEAEKEIEELRRNVSEKENLAIQMVLRELI